MEGGVFRGGEQLLRGSPKNGVSTFRILPASSNSSRQWRIVVWIWMEYQRKEIRRIFSVTIHPPSHCGRLSPPQPISTISFPSLARSVHHGCQCTICSPRSVHHHFLTARGSRFRTNLRLFNSTGNLKQFVRRNQRCSVGVSHVAKNLEGPKSVFILSFSRSNG